MYVYIYIYTYNELSDFVAPARVRNFSVQSFGRY